MLKSAVNHSNTQIGVAEAEQLGLTWLITLIYDGIDLFSRPTSVYGVNKHLKLCTISQSNRPCQDVSIYAYFGAFCCELVGPIWRVVVVPWVAKLVTARFRSTEQYKVSNVLYLLDTSEHLLRRRFWCCVEVAGANFLRFSKSHSLPSREQWCKRQGGFNEKTAE